MRALAVADLDGGRRPQVSDLSAEDVDALAQATLDHLRTRRSTDSPTPGWSVVRSFDSGVLRWWCEQLGHDSFPSDRSRRLQTLRAQIYDFLQDDRALIIKEPGQNSPVHVAPLSASVTEPEPDEITVSSAGAGFGTAASNAQVEAAAMEAAVSHFAGWDAEDVSAEKCGWDITFRRGAEVVHAEVKGVSGRRPSILLTANEYHRAQIDEHWLLVVVVTAMVSPTVVTFSREDSVAAARPYVFRVDLA